MASSAQVGVGSLFDSRVSMETISTSSYCRACGRGIKNADRFCGYCGTHALPFQRLKVLRYDGVYVTKTEMDRNVFVRRYFRFYPDGFVIGALFGSLKDDVATWWGRHQHDGPKGYYRIKRREIEFACTADWGTTVYVGKVRKDGLRITSANGKPCSVFYRFFDGEEGVEAGSSGDLAVSVADQCADRDGGSEGSATRASVEID